MAGELAEAPRRPGLWPREHGAYVQLLAPLLAALVAGRPTVAAWAWCVAAIAGFLAHEPLLVLLDRRGARAARELAPTARLAFASRVVVAIGAAGAAGIAAPASLRGLVVPLLLLAAALPFVARGTERSLAGEIVIASALAAAALPVALASALPIEPALTTWALWSLGFAAVTASVRSLMPAARRTRPLHAWLVIVAAAGALAGIFALGTSVRTGAPLTVAAIAVALVRPHPRHLRLVGVAITGVALLSAL